MRGAVRVPARFLILGIRDGGAGFATLVEDNDGCVPSCGSDRDMVSGRVLGCGSGGGMASGRVLGCGSAGGIVAGTVLGLILVESAVVTFLRSSPSLARNVGDRNGVSVGVT